MEEARGREAQIINERKKKIQGLKDEGVNPYPSRFDLQEKRTLSEDIKKEFGKLKNEEKTGEERVVAGRIMTKRTFGKLNFISLQDQAGLIQIVIQKGESPDSAVTQLKQIDSGDIVAVRGAAMKTKTGEISILAEEITILTKSILPLPDKHSGLQDKEERYRKRYLDLIMNPEIRNVFSIRAKVISAIREFLVKKGYDEVETPVLQPIYGGTSARPFESNLNALDMKVYMRFSNEMYLKRLIGGGYEKIFEFSRDFRNEGIDATHNPEFTLMETMCAYADYTENMDLVEEMLEFVAKEATGST